MIFDLSLKLCLRVFGYFLPDFKIFVIESHIGFHILLFGLFFKTILIFITLELLHLRFLDLRLVYLLGFRRLQIALLTAAFMVLVRLEFLRKSVNIDIRSFVLMHALLYPLGKVI